MIFATDLDNTMIFSRRVVGNLSETMHCVEFYNGNPITYMTYESISKLKYLLSNVSIIPTTTRSISQFKRIEFFSSTEFAIADNGGTILHNGSIQSDWNKYIKEVLKDYDFERVLNVFKTLPSLISEPKVIDGKFVFAKSDEIDHCRNILESKLNLDLWQISFQNKKVYAIPSIITKGNALKFIYENLIKDKPLVISAGDSNLDISMLNCADFSIVPCNCKLSDFDKYLKTSSDTAPYYAEEILDFVISKI